MNDDSGLLFWVTLNKLK